MATAARRGGRPKIKPPKKHGPDFSADKTWLALSKSIQEIQNRNAASLSFEENYRYAYNMVLYKQGEALYKGVNHLVAENLERLAKEQIIPKFPTSTIHDPFQQSQAGELLLKALRELWDDHTSNMNKLGQLLKYMDRVYTKNAEVPETWECGLELFLKHIIRPPIKGHLMTAILNQVQYERDGFVINRSTVKGSVDVFLQLKTDNITVYKHDLEPVFLLESEKFYKEEATKLLATCDAPEYLRRVEGRFESEDSRTNHYLSRQTSLAISQILKDVLLTPHLSTVISMPNSGLDAMIDTNKVEDLARLYRLYTQVPTGLQCLKRALKESITRRGKEVNDASLGVDTVDVDVDGTPDEPLAARRKTKAKGQPSNAGPLTAIKWVQDVLDLKDKFDSVWKNGFKADREIEAATNEAFESFINLNEKAPEFTSLFIDDHLKRGLKGKSEDEVDIVLDKTITVFRYFTDKDVFERYYKGHLAKRLLNGRSVSDDAERGMLAKLKLESGYQFTSKLEGMFNDMKLSVDAMDAYREYIQKHTPSTMDMSVIVMTSTFWPISHLPPECVLPVEMVNACKSFETFYLSRHSGRRLTWQLSLGNADVRVAFKTRIHDLNVSTYALVILLLFEGLGDDDFLTYPEIKTGTSIEDVELKRNLQSLACAKFKILKKHPPGRDVNDEDAFSFNQDFSSTMQRIKISTISSKVENSDERKETRDRIEEERKFQMDACAVRIMKDRKHMTHNDLINEITRQLATRFLPDPLAIKKRIETLIEREYLERCEDRKSYNYLA